MRAIRRIVSLGLLGSLLVIPASIPAVAQSGAPAKVTHRQSVQTELSPTGEVGVSRVYTQIAVEGDGSVDVVLPDQATGSLRNLEGFGSPTIDGDRVTYTVDATPGGVKTRTVADNTAAQPVEVTVLYELDGETLEPEDVVGESGTLTATYTVRNTTTAPEEITYYNGQGRAQTEMVDVSVPMVGSLSTTLDPRFSGVTAPGAAVAGDGRGNTVVNVSLLLFAPLGSDTAVATWTAEVDDAVIPPARIQVLPVNSRSFGSIRSGQESFKGVSDGLTDLTNGALIVDGNAKLLASGAGQLFDGLKQLQDGAGALNAGLADTAAPGARTLSDGLGSARAGGGELSDGLGELADGAGRLSDGLGSARAGSGELASGLGELNAGAGQLSGGLSSAASGGGELAAGLSQLEQGAKDLSAGLGQLSAGSTAVAGGLTQLEAGLGSAAEGTAALRMLATGLEGSFLGSPAALSEAIAGLASIDQVLAIGESVPSIAGTPIPGAGPGGATVPYGALLGAARAGVGQVSGGLQQNKDALGSSPADCTAAVTAVRTTPPEQLSGLVVMAALRCIATQVDTGIRTGAGDTPSAVDAAAALSAGATQIADGLVAAEAGGKQLAAGAGLASGGAGALVDGLGQLDAGGKALAAGAGKASEGAGALSDGLVQLDDGASQLAAGSIRARDGSVTLSDGLGQLDDGAERLADGLQDAADGSGQLADGAGAAAEGGEKVADGTVALSERGIGAIIEGATDAAGAPSLLYEHLRAADRRGQSPDALPYGTTERANASAVFAYELAGLGVDDGPSMPVQGALAMIGLALMGGLGLVVRGRAV